MNHASRPSPCCMSSSLSLSWLSSFYYYNESEMEKKKKKLKKCLKAEQLSQLCEVLSYEFLKSFVPTLKCFCGRILKSLKESSSRSSDRAQNNWPSVVISLYAFDSPKNLSNLWTKKKKFLKRWCLEIHLT